MKSLTAGRYKGGTARFSGKQRVKREAAGEV